MRPANKVDTLAADEIKTDLNDCTPGCAIVVTDTGFNSAHGYRPVLCAGYTTDHRLHVLQQKRPVGRHGNPPGAFTRAVVMTILGPR